ncbi:hypothetical protein RS85_01599 [Microbacterium sp. SA39]|nr:hypothetical protein RS85_01599 [Microbacterium sp. SA39]
MASELRRSRRTVGWLSEQSGIEVPLLAAKLREDEDFTIADLANIAPALDVPVSSLMPDDRVTAP